MKTRSFLFFFCIIFSVSSAQQYIFDFLRTDVGARVAALNGSFVSVTDDPNGIFYNPASLATLEKTRVSLSYFKHYADINSGSAAVATTIDGVGHMGLGIIYFDYGSFDRTDESNNYLGTFNPTDLALVVGWGTMIDDDMSIGFNAEYVHSSIADYASAGLAAGFGLLYIIPSQNLTIGGSILHAGKQLKTYNGVQESLPLDVKIGVTKKPEHLPVLLSLDFHKLNESADSFIDRLSAFTLGAEFLMSESLRLRFGYNNEQHRDLKLSTQAGLAGFSVGGGLVIRDYQIDYAYNSYGVKIGGLHHLSLGINL